MNEPTYVLVDGENIDTTLGCQFLHRKPLPQERPRWGQVLTFARTQYGPNVHGLFFLNGSDPEKIPHRFVAALRKPQLGYQVVLLGSRNSSDKVVDVGINRTLEAILNRPGRVMLVSHDGDFAPALGALQDQGKHVSVLCFPEMASAKLSARFPLHDLEHDAQAFQAPLKRHSGQARAVDLAEFNPASLFGA